MWTIWDKTSEINGFPAEAFLARNKHLTNEEVIFLKSVNGRVTQVEGKGILAAVYNIDINLPDNEFIAEYERVISTPVEEPEANTL